MNIDNPKLTAFALGELNEPEKSKIAREVAQSPEAQRMVNETRELTRALKNEFATEMQPNIASALRAVEERRTAMWLQRKSLSDIRDDPWFWSIGRPLAVAAAVAIFAVLSAILIGTYSRHDSDTRPPTDYAVLEGEEKPATVPELIGPASVPNPLGAVTIKRIERVVIGEINVDPHFEHPQLSVLETISDAYRVGRLKKRLSAPVVSKTSDRRTAGPDYGLIFLDRAGQVVAGARFYRAADSGFVLQPLRNAYERAGRYFVGGDAVLPGDWQPDVDYTQYVIQFPDWDESIGYAPGA